MNLGDFVTAREHLEKLSTQSSGLDFVWYGLAVLECLTAAPQRACSIWPRPFALTPEPDSRHAMIRISATWQTIRDLLSYSIPRGRSARAPKLCAPVQFRRRALARSPASCERDVYAQPDRCSEAGLRIVAIGGGTGLSTLLRGLKRHVISLTSAGSSLSAPIPPYISRLTASSRNR